MEYYGQHPQWGNHRGASSPPKPETNTTAPGASTDTEVGIINGQTASIEYKSMPGMEYYGNQPHLGNPRGTTTPPDPEPEPEPEAAGTTPSTGFTLPPAVHFHPHSQSGVAVKDEDNRVLSCPDLMGLADAISTAGPMEMTDALGRKFWRFSGDAWMNIAESFSARGRSFSAFAAVRSHTSSTNNKIIRLGQQGGSTLADMIDIAAQGGGISALRVGGRALTSASPDWNRMIVGSEITAVGGAARSSANGGNLCLVNGHESSAAQSGVNTSVDGAVIGGISTSNYRFDLYELILYNTGLDDADARAAQAALVANWEIAPITHRILFEGDSTLSGTAGINSGEVAAMAASAPDLIKPGCSIVSIATSGSSLAGYANRRDMANGWASSLIETGTVVLMTGTNDMGAQGMTLQQAYDGIVDYVKTNASLGMKAIVCINIAGGADVMTLRDMLAEPQFITDCEGDTGQQYAGMVKTAPVHLIEHDGARRFFDTADRTNRDYYLSDQIHLTGLGATILGNGGDTPEYGISGVIAQASA